MAEENSANSEYYDLSSLLSSEERNFLIRSNGDQVNITDLSGKIVGLYFSASWCPPCRGFTPNLTEVYKELSSKGDFEVVFISSDSDEESFKSYFSKMPWLAIPFSDSAANDSVNEKFSVQGIPHLVILNGDGKLLTDEGVELVGEYQAEAYPFTPERVIKLKEEEEAAKRNQSLKSLLVSSFRDYVISSNGNKIPVSQLEGKMVGLYFSVSSDEYNDECTEKLMDIYNKLQEKGENFEIVLIYLDETDEKGFRAELSKLPWLSLPFKDEKIDKLFRYFEIETIPSLVIILPDGKTMVPDEEEFIDESLPANLKHELHEHELVKVRRNVYFCDGCLNARVGLSFYCEECDFDLDSKCVMKSIEGNNDYDGGVESNCKPDYVCEGDVCCKI